MVTVAINAQVNPGNPGGAESAIQGMIAHFERETRSDDRVVLLATERYAPAFRQLARPRQEVMVWPFPQVAYAPFRTMTRRWQRVQRRAGRLGFGVDAFHNLYWHASRALARPPSGAQADRALRACRVDVVHFPYAVHFETSLPFLYEPLDLQHRHFPDLFSEGELRWRDTIYRRGCERARLIVTGTRYTKHDIVREYGIDPARIAVIPIRSAVPATPPTPDQVARVRQQYGLPERFLFYPAMAFPHKNHLRLFEALAVLRDAHGIVLPLVCTGRAYESHTPVLEQAMARLRLQDQVMSLGPVPTDDLIGLFGAAWALVFPSLFEGIGMPVLEALQFGLPVIASNASCIPEVAGEAAIYFDPTSVVAIADALREACEHPEMLSRPLEKAPATLARFSWPKAARTYFACYRAAAGQALTTEEQSMYDEAISR
jgi:glycosyltransferase involved in cell wall biosynthesis